MYEEGIKCYLPKIIGKGYGQFWRSRDRYLVVKGGRGSKKSSTAALKIIVKMMQMKMSNTLVVRRYDTTNKDSTYAQLIWAINTLQVSHLWKQSLSPLSLVYMPTGQKIIFRGLDDPQSITSITIPNGYLNFVWIEEAFQIEDEKAFDKLDLSIRGSMEGNPELYKQLILTFNPWEQHHWLKKRFFDNPPANAYVDTTTYLTNEFLGREDIELFNFLKVNDPKRYQVEGLGDWGVLGGRIYTRWKVEDFDVNALRNEFISIRQKRYLERYGLDFGYAEDPCALVGLLIDVRRFKIYVFKERYERHMDNAALANMVQEEVPNSLVVYADSEDPRTINELQKLGCGNVKGVKKGKNSVLGGIRTLNTYEMIIHPSCENFISEIEQYHYKLDKYSNEPLPEVEKKNDHLMDSMRYASTGIRALDFSWTQNIY